MNENLFLDLMKRVLTNVVYEDPNDVLDDLSHVPPKVSCPHRVGDPRLQGRELLSVLFPLESVHGPQVWVSRAPRPDLELARTYRETQACGRVLIASNIPLASEVVIHGVTGLLFPCRNVAALPR